MQLLHAIPGRNLEPLIIRIVIAGSYACRYSVMHGMAMGCTWRTMRSQCFGWMQPGSQLPSVPLSDTLLWFPAPLLYEHYRLIHPTSGGWLALELIADMSHYCLCEGPYCWLKQQCDFFSCAMCYLSRTRQHGPEVVRKSAVDTSMLHVRLGTFLSKRGLWLDE